MRRLTLVLYGVCLVGALALVGVSASRGETVFAVIWAATACCWSLSLAIGIVLRGVEE